MNINKHKGKFILIGIVILLVGAIFLKKTLNKDSTIKSPNIISQEKNNDIFQSIDNLSSWIVYWDLNVDSEINMLNDKLSSISYFAVNFNQNNDLIIPEKLKVYYDKTKSYNYEKYITIVNDVVNDDGTSSLKDKEILNILLSDKLSREKHISDIIDLAKEYEFDGIEIDYEQIKDDLGLWENYILFINQLYNKALNNNLKLRVVLEPNAPIDKLNFTEGPTYVMMCYNLHGGFSAAGEKTNQKFIKELIDKMKVVPGEKSFAIPTGGFDWKDNGDTKSVSEIEAKQILIENNIEAKRDDKSKYLYFNYRDKENIKHEVWYADQVTLEYLSEIIKEEGYDVSLWRLGGNLFDN
ncbi:MULTISPECIES: glycosyl hydrolase family 18 protein [unclassified Clostridium]|uniref:glycosyl hydrolase family 18 protein n=1 Tax=unclassified Clostridium TaxID=2614128 RepID=UPI00189BB1B7|nr:MULTISPECIES: glycosyl hydrolase family 18 protein [unclassified Clostridium]